MHGSQKKTWNDDLAERENVARGRENGQNKNTWTGFVYSNLAGAIRNAIADKWCRGC